jgi:hypothetical protein
VDARIVLKSHLESWRIPAVLVVMLLACAANASGQLTVIPLLQEETVNRGGMTPFELRVTNHGDEAVSLAVEAHPMDVAPDGLPMMVDGTSEMSCAEWISFSPKEVALAAQGAATIRGVIRAPGDAQGSYCALLVASYRPGLDEVIFGEQGKSKASLNLGIGVSSVLLVTVRSSENKVSLRPDSLLLHTGRETGSSAGPLKSGKSADIWHADLGVENTGSVYTVVRGEVSIWTEDFRLIERARLSAGRGYVLPRHKRLLSAAGTKPLPDGVYVVRVNLQPRGGGPVQGTFPYSVVDGVAKSGAASERVRELIALATPAFTLSRNSLDYSILPGVKRTEGIQLTNLSAESLYVSPRLADWMLNKDGRLVLDPESSPDAAEADLSRSALAWLDVTPNPIVLPPRRSATAKVTLSAPDLIDGEYYAAVVFDTGSEVADLPDEIELPRTVIVTASSPGQVKYLAEVASVEHTRVSSLLRNFTVNVENKGNVHCFVDGTVTIFDLSYKQMLDPVAFGGPGDFVLPGRSRGYVVSCTGSLPPGRYEAVIEVKYNEQSPPAISKIKFAAEG